MLKISVVHRRAKQELCALPLRVGISIQAENRFSEMELHTLNELKFLRRYAILSIESIFSMNSKLQFPRNRRAYTVVVMCGTAEATSTHKQPNMHAVKYSTRPDRVQF